MVVVIDLIHFKDLRCDYHLFGTKNNSSGNALNTSDLPKI